jgi:hypothetical protein
MSWKREREGLIAQTLAFVQSVTGKGSERPADAAVPPLPTETETPPRPPVGAAALLAVETALGPPPRSATPGVAPAVTPKVALQRFEPQRRESPNSELRSPELSSPELPSLERSSPPAPPPILQRPIPQSEMVREIRARIASFRAHQERFNREREEYFAATLARLRASLRDAPPPPRIRK